jgi:hypothetical protein
MDETTQDTGEIDVFSRLLAELHAPTTEAVAAPERMSSVTRRGDPPAAAVEPSSAWSGARAPELMGADELAAPPRPFPPATTATPPLVQPPVAVPSTVAPSPVAPPHVVFTTDAPAAAAPTPAALRAFAPPSIAPAARQNSEAAPVAALDFAALLTTPTTSPDPSSPSSVPLVGTGVPIPDEPDIARSTVGERVILVLAVLIPPLGLIAALIGSLVSVRRRGWVVGVLKAALTIGIVLTVVVGVLGYVGYSLLRQQQAHDQTVAQSAAFCATIKANPTMVQLPDFGWPAVADSIPDSLTAMQAYEGRWTKLAAVSPDGVRREATTVAAAAQRIIDGVKLARTINDASNIAVMSQIASASGVPAWHANYCK